MNEIEGQTIHFIINPKAGNRKRIYESTIAETCNALGVLPVVQYTEYKGHAKKLALEAKQAGVQRIVAIGGDGTINEVACQLIHSDVILGIIPCGSGNGLARKLHVPSQTQKALNRAIKGKTFEIDTFSINNIPIVSISGLGFDALIAFKLMQAKKRGFKPYFIYSIQNYFSYKPIDYQIITESQTINTKALLVAIANSGIFGFNASISPISKLNDGKIEICILKKVPGIIAPLIAPALFTNILHFFPWLTIVQVEKAVIRQAQPSVFNLDGESIEIGKELNIQVHPASLKVSI